MVNKIKLREFVCKMKKKCNWFDVLIWEWFEKFFVQVLCFVDWSICALHIQWICVFWWICLLDFVCFVLDLNLINWLTSIYVIYINWRRKIMQYMIKSKRLKRNIVKAKGKKYKLNWNSKRKYWNYVMPNVSSKKRKRSIPADVCNFLSFVLSCFSFGLAQFLDWFRF